jgi:hypothetical protein
VKNNLLGFRVSNLLLINPSRGFRIGGVIDLFRRVDGRGEVLKEATSVHTLSVEENIVSVSIRAEETYGIVNNMS